MAYAAPGADLDITEELPIVVLEDVNPAGAEVAATDDLLDVTEELPVVHA